MLVWMLQSPAWALQGDFSACRQQFLEVPVSRDDSNDFALCFTGFAVQYSGNTKTPVFSAAALDRARMVGARVTQRFNEFYEEARLPFRVRSLFSDYKRSGFDRGHMYPSGDSDNDETAIQSMSLANMVPQAPELNRGVWNKIERDVRRYAERAQGKVYVITGPAYRESPPRTIGRGVGVPSHVWKLIHDAAQQRSWAYWIENRNEAKAPEIIDVITLSERTGLQFPGYESKAKHKDN
jgi:endonuclease G